MASLEERKQSHLNLTRQFLWTRHSSPCLYRVGKEWGRGGGWRRTVWEDVIQAWLMTCASEPDESRTFSAFSVFSKSVSLKEGVCECSAGGCLQVFSKRVFLSVQQEGVSECSARGCFWVFSKRVFLSVQQEGVSNVSECSARGCFWVFSKRVFQIFLSVQQEGVSKVSKYSARGCFKCFWVFSKRVFQIFLSVQQDGASECLARVCFKCLSVQQEGVSEGVFSKRVLMCVQPEGASNRSAKWSFWVLSEMVLLSLQQKGVSEWSARGWHRWFMRNCCLHISAWGALGYNTLQPFRCTLKLPRPSLTLVLPQRVWGWLLLPTEPTAPQVVHSCFHQNCHNPRWRHLFRQRWRQRRGWRMVVAQQLLGGGWRVLKLQSRWFLSPP